MTDATSHQPWPMSASAAAPVSAPASASARAAPREAAEPLRPLAFPLHGSRLIEASAGTGKTYTIATLYVRLVLGHGGAAAFARPLSPPEILVVTFTDAATQELRERIRARLMQAAQCFEAPPSAEGEGGTHGEDETGRGAGENAENGGASGERGASAVAGAAADPLLRDLRASYAPDLWPACARRLRLAAEWMDEAAVSTIHAWCYRMLREHAFDSGSLFRQELLSDEDDLLALAVRDYWRRHFYALPPASVAEVLRCHASPDALLAALRPLLGRPDAVFTVNGQPVRAPRALDDMIGAAAQWHQAHAALELRAREAWAADAPALRELLRELLPDLNATAFPEKKDEARFEAWLAALETWATTGERDDKLKPARLAQGGIKLKGKKAEPGHAAFEAIAAWSRHEQTRPDIGPALTLHALHDVRRALGREKDRRAELGFDDLLVRLDAALHAPQGEALASAIRQRFPVALIDEFQDTDPLQYRIFERVYPPQALGDGDGEDRGEDGGASPPAEEAEGPHSAGAPRASASASAGLFMIGDPKQAIYAFRGADIQTYLQARAATRGRHYTLGTNYRSTEGMVEAVNHAFAYAEQHHARGAFRFARPGADNPLPFWPVRAQGREEHLEIAGEPACALTAWLLAADDPAPAGEPPPAQARDDTAAGVGVIGPVRYREEMAERSASAIRGWLALAREGRAGLRRAGQALRPLRPADIAILVRGRTEAEAMRQALARRQIASVYLSDRDSVFGTPEAADVRAWLQACAEPADDGLLRAALATATLGLAWHELERLNLDELHWEALVQRLQDYRRVWRRQGVLPMLRRWLADFGVAARLLGQPDGERRLTNVLHVAEWLQRQSAELDGEHALIRALAERLAHPAQEEVLRLESDADLIKVVTIHKSKGLEYPLVLLPFISGWKDVDGRASSVGFHPPPPEDSEGTAARTEGAAARGLARMLAAAAGQSADDAVNGGTTDGMSGGMTGGAGGGERVAAQAPGQTKAAEAGRYTVELSRERAGMAYALEQANDERLSEDMRLLYVALTRARHAVWLGVAPLAAGGAKRCGLHRGALGYLLAGGAEIEAGALRGLLQAWRGDQADIAIVSAPLATPDVLPAQRAAEPGPARVVAARLYEPWWIASYSALRTIGGVADDNGEEGAAAGGRSAPQAEPASAREADLRESAVTQALLQAPATRLGAEGEEPIRGPGPGTGLEAADGEDAIEGPEGSEGAEDPEGAERVERRARAGGPHAFPKGAEAGSFLHSLLEQAAALGFARAVAQPQGLREVIARRCAVRGWQAWIDPLADWLQDVLATPLPLPDGAAVALAGLASFQCEMEFWFAARQVDTRALDRLVVRHTLEGLPRPALRPETLNGMLKGYMDLVFEHQGRYYIADYKSNELGPDDAAYTPAAVADAMREHRYDLQYALYTLALHRLLRARLPDYDYARHMGGVVYVFLRGIHAPGRGVFAQRPPRELVDELDALFDGTAHSDTGDGRSGP